MRPDVIVKSVDCFFLDMHKRTHVNISVSSPYLHLRKFMILQVNVPVLSLKMCFTLPRSSLSSLDLTYHPEELMVLVSKSFRAGWGIGVIQKADKQSKVLMGAEDNFTAMVCVSLKKGLFISIR